MSSENTRSYRRAQVATLCATMFAQAAAATVQQGFPALAPLMSDAFQLSARQLSILLATPLVGLALSVYAWGRMADRLGERMALALGMGIGSAGLAVTALSNSYHATILFLLIGATGASAAHAAGGRALVRAFPPHKHGFVLGLRHMMIPFGGAAGAAMLPRVADISTPSHACFALAIVNGVAFVIVAAAVPRRDRSANHAAQPSPKPDKQPIARELWVLGAGAGLFALLQFGLITFLVLYLHHERGWSVAAAGTALAAMQVVAGLSRAAAGVLSDRLNRRAGLIAMIAVVVAVVCCVAAIGGAIATPAMLIATAISSSWNGVLYAAVAEYAPEGTTGASFGMQTTILSAAGAAAPLLMGAVVHGAGWPAAFTGLALLGALSAGILGVVLPRLPRQRTLDETNATPGQNLSSLAQASR